MKIPAHAKLLAMLMLTSAVSGTIGSPAPIVGDSAPDVFVPEDYQSSQSFGSSYLGVRMQANFSKRVEVMNIPWVTSEFQNPGTGTCGDWQGEFAGKLLDALCWSWEYTGDAAAKARMDSLVSLLKGYQGTNGYLGTYPASCRWTTWDVWNHQYDLVGLLHYYRATGDTATLTACRRIGDLICTTFGIGKLDIINSSWYHGMPSTSILESMVMLFRYTGDAKYRAFCDYITTVWEESGGSKIVSSMLAGLDITDVDTKAYEKMSTDACQQALPEISELIRSAMHSRNGRLPKRSSKNKKSIKHTPDGLNEELN